MVDQHKSQGVGQIPEYNSPGARFSGALPLDASAYQHLPKHASGPNAQINEDASGIVLPAASPSVTASPAAATPLSAATSPANSGAFPAARPDTTGAFPAARPDTTGSFPPARPGATGSFSAQAEQAAPRPQRAPGIRPVIVFDRVTKSYQAHQRTPALNNITLEVYPGEFVFLVGHSGSGKSTFIRLLNREFVTTSGKILVAGEELTRMRQWRVPYLRRNIGCVFQDFKLLPNKTAFQNVAFALEVIGKSRHIIRTQVPEVLRLVGLESKTNKYPDQLSGGEQQRVSIARAIVNRPPILICDEPTGNLDPQTSFGIMRLLDRINRTGTTIVVATHDREMVDSMRKRVIALENGYLVRDQHKGVYGEDA